MLIQKKIENNTGLQKYQKFVHLFDILYDASIYHFDKSVSGDFVPYNRWFADLRNENQYIFNVHKLNKFGFSVNCDWIIISPENYLSIEYVENAKTYYCHQKITFENNPSENLNELLSGKAKTSFRANQSSSENIDMTCLASGLFNINELVNEKLDLYQDFIFPRVKSNADIIFNMKHLENYKKINPKLSEKQNMYFKTMIEYFNVLKINEFNKPLKQIYFAGIICQERKQLGT